MTSIIVIFFVGVIFSMGFGLGGVAKPETIVNFLDFFGNWDPSVMLVMGAAVPVTFVGYKLVFRRSRPLLDRRFFVPTRRDIDGRLLGGAALFGAGWGLIGYCPGPALASVPTGSLPVFVWLASMGAGMLLFKVWDEVQAARAARKQANENGNNDRQAAPA